MASVALIPSENLPVGATVAAYPASNWLAHQLPPSGAPVGSSTTSGTMGATGVTLSGLTEGVRYFVHAEVSTGVHRYVQVVAGADVDPDNDGMTRSGDETVPGDKTFTGAVDLSGATVTAPASLATQAELDTAVVSTTARAQRALTARGLLAENFNLATATANATIATQIIYGGLIGLNAGDTVTSLVVCVHTAGSGTAPTTIKLGLTDTAGQVLAVTANVASDSKWTSTGVKKFNVGTPYPVTVSGGYYVVVLQDGAFASTALQFPRANSVGAQELTALSGGVRPAVITSGGKTDISGTLTLADASASTTYWFGAV